MKDHQVTLRKKNYQGITIIILITSEKGDKYQGLARELKDYTQRIGKKTERLGNKRTKGDHPDYSIIKLKQNTEKSPGDLRRLVVSQTPVKDYQLTLRRKISRSKIIIIIIINLLGIIIIIIIVIIIIIIILPAFLMIIIIRS